MLFNPKWTDNKPSVAGFRLWLEQQPPTREFLYYDCNRCALGQYLIACGTNWQQLSSTDGDLLARLNYYAREAAKESRSSPAWITAPMVLREMEE